MKSFLENRKQYVQVDRFRSENLMVGPNSVVQGSVLSCTLYLIFILDLPELFHKEKHDPIHDRNCSKTSIKTFIDDTYLKVNKENNKDLKTTVGENMEKIYKRKSIGIKFRKKHRLYYLPKIKNTKKTLLLY